MESERWSRAAHKAPTASPPRPAAPRSSRRESDVAAVQAVVCWIKGGGFKIGAHGKREEGTTANAKLSSPTSRYAPAAPT